MTAPKFAGIIPPLCTPFHDDFTVDTASLRRQFELMCAQYLLEPLR